jgi:rubrerythrin
MREMLQSDRDLEISAVKEYKQAIQVAVTEKTGAPAISSSNY